MSLSIIAIGGITEACTFTANGYSSVSSLAIVTCPALTVPGEPAVPSKLSCTAAVPPPAIVSGADALGAAGETSVKPNGTSIDVTVIAAVPSLRITRSRVAESPGSTPPKLMVSPLLTLPPPPVMSLTPISGPETA